METKEIFGLNLKAIRKANFITIDDLAKKLNVSKGSISAWENGKTQPNSATLAKICDLFDTTPDILFSPHLTEIKNENDINNLSNRTDVFNKIKNLIPIQKKKIPVLGSIACGKPIYADENLEFYADVIDNVKADFALYAKGDSMINARIYDGDLVFIKQQEMVENGEIAAVLINDEATLKRIYYDKVHSIITLVAENPIYPPFIYKNQELNNIKILGKAVAFQSLLK